MCRVVPTPFGLGQVCDAAVGTRVAPGHPGQLGLRPGFLLFRPCLEGRLAEGGHHGGGAGPAAAAIDAFRPQPDLLLTNAGVGCGTTITAVGAVVAVRRR
jgi:hypothetical protein